MNDPVYFQVVFQDFSLTHITRYAIQNQHIDVGLEEISFDPIVDLGLPEINCKLIGNKLSLTGKLHELLAEVRPGIKRAEDIPTGAMEKPGNRAQDLSLCALPRAWGPYDQDRGMKFSRFSAHCFARS